MNPILLSVYGGVGNMHVSTFPLFQSITTREMYTREGEDSHSQCLTTLQVAIIMDEGGMIYEKGAGNPLGQQPPDGPHAIASLFVKFCP